MKCYCSLCMERQGIKPTEWKDSLIEYIDKINKMFGYKPLINYPKGVVYQIEEK